MKKKSDISIIIPCYNSQNTISKCLESLISQTKKELEFIVINDGSTDDTEEIIRKYTTKDARIKYFKNKNHGIGYTRNFGINKAVGQYLMFIDSDDYIEQDACEKLYNRAIKDKLDLVICDFYKVYDNGKKEEEKIISFNNTTLRDNPELIRAINLSPWNKLYNSKLIKDNSISFIENLKYEDAPFVSTVMDKAKRIGKIDECLINYTIHKNSETTIRDDRCFDILKIMEMIRNYYKNKAYIKTDLDKMTVRLITNYTIQQRYQKDKKIAISFINKAFDFLKKEVPNYKNNDYYEKRGIIRRTIEKSKLFTKIYCTLYIK